MTRCFVAIDLDERIKDRVFELQQKIAESSLKLVKKENLHITLKFLGEVPEDKVHGVVKRLESIKLPRFDTEVMGMGAFPDINYIRVVWLGIRDDSQLVELAKAVDEGLYDFTHDDQIRSQSERQATGFSSHLTIARVKSKPSALREVILQNKDIFIGKQRVERFSLKKSILLSKGPIYEDLSVFTLA